MYLGSSSAQPSVSHGLEYDQRGWCRMRHLCVEAGNIGRLDIHAHSDGSDTQGAGRTNFRPVLA